MAFFRALAFAHSYEIGTRWFLLVPDWYQNFKTLVTDWHQIGTRSVPDWSEIGARFVPDWYQIGTGLLPHWSQMGGRWAPDRSKAGDAHLASGDHVQSVLQARRRPWHLALVVRMKELWPVLLQPRIVKRPSGVLRLAALELRAQIQTLLIDSSVIRGHGSPQKCEGPRA